MSRFIDPRVWASHVDNTEIREREVADQARFVAMRLPEVAAAAAADPTIESKLVQRGEQYMRRRLGYDRG